MSLSEQEFGELREKLLAEKNALEKSLSEHGKKVGKDWTGTPAGFEEMVGDEPEDAGDRMEELATNVSLVEELERRHKEVDEAIARMEQGTYGKDENTGEPIPIERLRADPSARTNV